MVSVNVTTQFVTELVRSFKEYVDSRDDVTFQTWGKATDSLFPAPAIFVEDLEVVFQEWCERKLVFEIAALITSRGTLKKYERVDL